jgi:acetyl esterase/lipase
MFLTKKRHPFMNRILLISGFLVLTGLFNISAAAAAKDVITTVPLWPGQAPGEVTEKQEKTVPSKDNTILLTNVSCPALSIYKTDKADTPAPAVLICPGGGYGVLSMDKEGTEVARWLNSIGFDAFVLKYRVPKNRPGALQDIQRAMGLIRQNAENWNIDPNRLGVMGFSAGAHLCASLAGNYEKRTYQPIDKADELSCRPDLAILIYPAYLSKDNYQTPDDIHVTKSTPPAFIFQTQDDRFADSSIAHWLALKKAGVPAELHLYPTGGHGYGLRPTNHAAVQWPKLCQTWLRQQVSKKQ